MGYDYEIQTKCKCCGLAGDRKELYTTYNHGWAFYEYLDKKHGLRWLYDKTGRGTVRRLETMLECLEHLDGYYNNRPSVPNILALFLISLQFLFQFYRKAILIHVFYPSIHKKPNHDYMLYKVLFYLLQVHSIYIWFVFRNRIPLLIPSVILIWIYKVFPSHIRKTFITW